MSDGAPRGPDPDTDPVVGEREAHRRIEDLNKGIAELQTALVRYGKHEKDCAHQIDRKLCTCCLIERITKRY